jgi:hypothetical protein
LKRAILVTLGVIVACSLCLAGTVSAYKAGYVFPNYQGTDITADGAVGASEWTDSFGDWLYDGWTKTTSTIDHKFEMGGTPSIADQWLIEVLSDTTNDAGDVFTYSFCGAQDDAATPQTDDVLINYTHSATTIYRGTGTGWAPDPAIVLGTNVIIASSIAASPLSATPHWIIELKFDKSGGIAGTSFDSNVRLAVYDASTGKTLMWPPMSDADVPSSWGLNDYSSFAGGTVPEGLTIGVMLSLSTISVIVSARYFRKPPKL